jgi:NAD(P)-dependent dehydrogenase (short-subunit alcohol dehydrogenase family)
MSNRWVLITGASSGIGRATALLLAHTGFSVIAGVRKTSDGTSLREAAEKLSSILQTVTLDVTDPTHIGALELRLPEIVRKDGLWALVNNAGIVCAGPTEALSAEVWQRQYTTNLLGPIALTTAMIPFLRKTHGRIVNVSSVGGRSSLPFMSAYTSSKFAMEGWSDGLRVELQPDGIEVVLIEPGAIKTPLWDKGQTEGADLISQLSPPMRTRYGGPLTAFRAMATKMEKAAIPPEDVARTIVAALSADRPRTRYLVGKDARIQAFLRWLLPDRAFDSLLVKMMGLPK